MKRQESMSEKTMWILCAEDVDQFRMELCHTLMELIPNCEVDCVEDGRDIIKMFESGEIKDFDFLVLDNRMKHVDGVDCIRHLEDSGYDIPPCAFFTGEPKDITDVFGDKYKAFLKLHLKEHAEYGKLAGFIKETFANLNSVNIDRTNKAVPVGRDPNP